MSLDAFHFWNFYLTLIFLKIPKWRKKNYLLKDWCYDIIMLYRITLVKCIRSLWIFNLSFSGGKNGFFIWLHSCYSVYQVKTKTYRALIFYNKNWTFLIITQLANCSVALSIIELWNTFSNLIYHGESILLLYFLFSSFEILLWMSQITFGNYFLNIFKFC